MKIILLKFLSIILCFTFLASLTLPSFSTPYSLEQVSLEDLSDQESQENPECEQQELADFHQSNPLLTANLQTVYHGHRDDFIFNFSSAIPTSPPNV